MRVLGILGHGLLVLLAGCGMYAPRGEDCALRCGPDDSCPSGWICREDDFCHASASDMLCTPPRPDGRPDSSRPPDGPPPDTCAPMTEVCNGEDDDCDAMVDEGFDVGDACDGDDADACEDGVLMCGAEGGVECSDDAAATPEVCDNDEDDDCDDLVDCLDPDCAPSPFCCSGTGLVADLPDACVADGGASFPGDSLQVYCCAGIARFCLSGEACNWRSGCGGGITFTCSRSGLSSDWMATTSCASWKGRTVFHCSSVGEIYFP